MSEFPKKPPWTATARAMANEAQQASLRDQRAAMRELRLDGTKALTVNELIARLSDMPGDHIVWGKGCDGCANPVIAVYAEPSGDPDVYLEVTT